MCLLAWLMVGAVLLVSISLLPVEPVAAAAPSVTLRASRITQGQNAVILLNGFAPRELVNIWITRADFTIMDLGDKRVNGAGSRSISVPFTTSDPPGRYAVSARGNVTGFMATAQFVLLPARGAPPSSGVRIQVIAPGPAQGEPFLFVGQGYTPTETVALWLRTPADTIIDLGKTQADEQGGFRQEFLPGSDYPSGRYFVTGYGMSSQLTGIARFVIQRGDFIETETGATLTITPRQIRQLDLMTIEGNNFGPGEQITLWLTLPNGTVQPLDDLPTIRTEQDGFFVIELTMPTSKPVGRYEMTAYGRDSNRRAIAPFTLLPAVDNIPNEDAD